FYFFSGCGLRVAVKNKKNINQTKKKFFCPQFFKNWGPAGGILYKFYKSGDLARYVLSGDIEYLGRIDQQVKIRGYRIELGEIESRLLNHRIIKDAVILAKANHSGENYLCAYVVLHEKSNAGHGMENELKEFLSHSLPGYMIPSYFIYLDRIPLTPNGKPDRKNLPDPFSRVATSNLEPPRTEIEKRIVEIWADVLNTDQSGIGLNANFFDLGGHSLKATTLISRIHKAFDVKVSLASFFEKPTVRWLSENIEKADYDSHVSIFPSEKKEYYCLSSAQKRLYFMNVQDPHSSGYNIPVVVNLEGTLDRSRLEKTFKTLFRRHESFRTSFPLMNGKPVQRIHDDINLEIEYLDLTLGTGKPDAIIQSFIRPFELDAGPLVRLGLIQTETHKHILMLDMHHIITDGYSMGIFIKEFMALYGEGKLPPIKIHYKDYSEWTDGDVGRTVIQQQETYWIKEFAIQPPILNLSTDFVRPPVQAFDGDVLEFEFSPEETTRLKVFVAEEHISLFILILALYNVFLFRLTGQEDIVIGTSISGRRNADLETVIGMFVQTLALRNYPQPEKTFRSFLRDVSSYTLRAFENQDYPFEDLVEKLNIKRDLSRNPIFDVMVEVLNFDTPEIQIPGLTLKPYPARRVEAKFDIDFQVREIRNTLLFSLIYKKTLFKKETIEKLNGYFKKVAMFFLENPDHQLSEVELAEMQKQNDLRSQFNEDLEDE
ncbi:MAG: condensation domain-containing protein, partial [Candidatus Omnitrophota bacterium]